MLKKSSKRFKRRQKLKNRCKRKLRMKTSNLQPRVKNQKRPNKT